MRKRIASETLRFARDMQEEGYDINDLVEVVVSSYLLDDPDLDPPTVYGIRWPNGDPIFVDDIDYANRYPTSRFNEVPPIEKEWADRIERGQHGK